MDTDKTQTANARCAKDDLKMHMLHELRGLNAQIQSLICMLHPVSEEQFVTACKVPDYHRALIVEQVTLMRGYSEILTKRLLAVTGNGRFCPTTNTAVDTAGAGPNAENEAGS